MNCLLVDDSYEISRSIFFPKSEQYFTKVYSAICHDRHFKGKDQSGPFQAPDKKFFDTD